MEVDDVMKLSLVWVGGWVGVDVRVCGNEGVCRGMWGSVWECVGVVGVGLWVMGVCCVRGSIGKRTGGVCGTCT